MRWYAFINTRNVTFESKHCFYLVIKDLPRLEVIRFPEGHYAMHGDWQNSYTIINNKKSFDNKLVMRSKIHMFQNYLIDLESLSTIECIGKCERIHYAIGIVELESRNYNSHIN